MFPIPVQIPLGRALFQFIEKRDLPTLDDLFLFRIQSTEPPLFKRGHRDVFQLGIALLNRTYLSYDPIGEDREP